MASSLNKNTASSDNIISIISSEKFGEYDAEMQREILKKIDGLKKQDGGVMGRFFGNKKELASMNIAFVICILLFVVGAIINEQQLWNGVLPIVGTTMGYIFGRGGGKAE